MRPRPLPTSVFLEPTASSWDPLPLPPPHPLPPAPTCVPRPRLPSPHPCSSTNPISASLTIKDLQTWEMAFTSLPHPGGPRIWSPEVKSWVTSPPTPLDCELGVSRAPLWILDAAHSKGETLLQSCHF